MTWVKKVKSLLNLYDQYVDRHSDQNHNCSRQSRVGFCADNPYNPVLTTPRSYNLLLTLPYPFSSPNLPPLIRRPASASTSTTEPLPATEEEISVPSLEPRPVPSDGNCQQPDSNSESIIKPALKQVPGASCQMVNLPSVGHVHRHQDGIR